MEKIKITYSEYERYRSEYCGICLNCGEFTEGDCEPDAVKYMCEGCGMPYVYGIEEAVLMEEVEIIYEDEDKDEDEDY